MPNTKIKFSVEDAKVLKENPNSNFAVLSLDFFASGENLHDMYVSEETLMRTADTIKNCPLVWKYDPRLNDIYTHDKDEVPCGFVPETSKINARKLEDGRTMLSIVAYVWKRYTGDLLSFFKRDGGKKPVSVEMTVYETEQMSNGLVEIKDFIYEGITILGSFVTPAIPAANATVLSFSKLKEEYEEDLKKEFTFASIDMTIPETVKNNAKKGLELRKEYGRGGTSVGIATAKYLVSNRTITNEKVRHVAKYFPRHKGDNLEQTDPPSNGYIAWLLWGGTTAWKWSQSIVDRLNEEEMAYSKEEEGLLTFPYKSRSEMNPALRGIEPPITVAQGNKIAKQADAVGAEKGGWGIAIKHFKDTHKVENGRWVRKESNAVDENFAIEGIGESDSLKVNKSKEKMSATPWGQVNKTKLMHDILKASNYKTLVDDVYMLVESGWEEHPSSSLKYPVMQIVGDTLVYNRYGLSAALQRARQQGENTVVGKVESIYKKMGLEVQESFEDDQENVQQTYLDDNTNRKEEKQNMQQKVTMDGSKLEKEKAEKMEAENKDTSSDEKMAEGNLPKSEEGKVEKMQEKRTTQDEIDGEDEEKDEPKKVSDEVFNAAEGKKVFEFLTSSAEQLRSKMKGEAYSDKSIKMFELISLEFAKGKGATAKAVSGVMLTYMKDSFDEILRYFDENNALKEKVRQLEEFKENSLREKFSFHVETVLAEALDAGLPKTEVDNLREESKNFSLDNVDVYENMVKAKAFVYVNNVTQGKKPAEEYVVRIGLPFSGDAPKFENEIWK